MFYEQVNDNENNAGMISTFYGYNHVAGVSAGEFYDEKNLSSIDYPLMRPRDIRKIGLNLASSDYNVLTLDHTNSVEGNLTDLKGIYDFETFECDKYASIKVTFNYEDDIFATLKSGDMFYLYINNEVVLLTGSDNYVEYEFTPNAESMHLKIVGEAADDDNFKVPDMDTYLYNITIEQASDHIRAICIKENKLVYVIKNFLYYPKDTTEGVVYERTDLSDYMGTDYESRLQLISYNTYILIFPYGICYNTITSEVTSLASEVDYAGSLKITLCKKDGTAIDANAQDDAPEDPTNGTYWLDTKDGGLYVYSDTNSTWNNVLTTYIALVFTGTTLIDKFNEGDAIYFESSNTIFTDLSIAEGSIIQAIGTNSDGNNYIVVTGILSDNKEKTIDSLEVALKRKIPTMDYVCVNQNRLWGCYHGLSEDGTSIINEIYASKLGDPTNWYCYAGISTDSYALSIGSDGDFTGCISYQGYPTFFKENVVYKIYGSYPSQYQLYTYDVRGVQKGSERSLAICGDYLIYKSLMDICVFDGSSTTTISSPLGNDYYDIAAAGACMNKYFISMRNEDDEYTLFTYDMEKSLWHKEDNLRIDEFCYNNIGQLYGQNGLKLYGFGRASEGFYLENEAEDLVEWYGITGINGLSIAGYKYINDIVVRAIIPPKSELRVSIAYDGNDFEELDVFRGDGTIQSYKISLNRLRCDNYRWKFEGHGDVIIYSYTTTYEEGSDDYGI